LREYRRTLVHKPLLVPASSSQDFSREIPLNETRSVDAIYYKSQPKRGSFGFGGRVGRVSLAPGEVEAGGVGEDTRF